MKFSIVRSELNSLLSKVAGAIDSRAHLPVLKNVYVEAQGQSLTLRANNVDMEITATTTDVVIEGEGIITLPGKKFTDIVRSLDEGSDLKFNLEGEDAAPQMIIKCGRSRFKLSTLPAQDFPSIDVDPKKIASSFNAESKALKGSLDVVQHFSAVKDVRYYLNGVLVEQSAEAVNLVATDGHRMACKGVADYDYQTTPEEPVNSIVQRNTISSIIKMCDEGESVSIQFTPDHVIASCEGVSLTARLIDGRFPDYRRVIPKGNEIKVSVDSAALTSALNSAKILSNEKYKGCELAISNSGLRVVSHNPEQEEADIEVGVDHSGEDITIGANTDYLINAVKAVGGSDVVLEMKDASSPILMNRESERTTVVVMPMRV